MGERRISPEEYGVNVREMPIEAAESRLFEGRDRNGSVVAFKVYPTVSLGQVKKYRDVTNSLAGKVKWAKTEVTLDVGGRNRVYAVRIVPINAFGVVDNPDQPGVQWPCTVSEYVLGLSLEDLDRDFLLRHGGAGPQNPLYQLSQELGRMVHKNIGIIPWNVKLIETGRRPTLMVTDICSSIRSL